MKKCFTIFFLCFAIVVCLIAGVQFSKNTQHHENYLRIHIRANSNLEEDQDVKYIIKDAIVDFLTPVISRCKTKQEFEKYYKERNDTYV